MKHFLFLVFTISLFGYDLDWEIYKQESYFELAQIPGFCTKEKADKLMNFIYEHKPSFCVEIGSMGGSTTYPIARALSFLKNGMLYAIDCWENGAYIEGLEADDPHIPWWTNIQVDMNALYQQFIFMLHNQNLGPYCRAIQLRSEKAAATFDSESIDFLYLDGNFSSEGSLRDAVLFFPKVKKGGHIWLNSAELDSKTETVAFLMKHAHWLKNESLGIHCIVFQK